MFEYFKTYFTKNVELFFNISLFIFLIYFIYNKVRSLYKSSDISLSNNTLSLKSATVKTLGFTYLNPHVYSDTVFFLGNFSKNFILYQKILFGAGASIASFTFFFVIGYLSKNLSKYAKSEKVWKVINIFIVSFMTILTLFIISEMIR